MESDSRNNTEIYENHKSVTTFAVYIIGEFYQEHPLDPPLICINTVMNLISRRKGVHWTPGTHSKSTTAYCSQDRIGSMGQLCLVPHLATRHDSYKTAEVQMSSVAHWSGATIHTPSLLQYSLHLSILLVRIIFFAMRAFTKFSWPLTSVWILAS